MGLKLTGTSDDGFESYGCGAGTVLELRGKAGIGFILCPRAVLYYEAYTEPVLSQCFIEAVLILG